MALQSQLKKMHAPKVFRCLKVNQLRHKEKKIKQQFADGFTVERVYQKIFKALYWNMIVCKDLKAMRTRAIGYYRGNLTQKGFFGLKMNSNTKIIKRANRVTMTRCI
jgi:predicted metal-binding transcription factor (methanogenesis marker protein 9)